MFQTEPILFLQSFAGSVLTSFMKGVTITGYTWFLSVAILVVLFGVDFRKGFYLFQIVLWTALVTNACKEIIAYPRPLWVDSNVKNLETGQPNMSPFNGMGAGGFFEPLSPTVVDANRLGERSFGFPSGHVSSAVALWGGLAFLFRKRYFVLGFPFLVVLMALSRMFLGRHFIADVLGGAAVGMIVLLVADQLLKKARSGMLAWQASRRAQILKWLGIAVAFLAVPLVLMVASLTEGNLTGSLIGITGAYLVLTSKGNRFDCRGILRRAASFLLGAGIYFCMTFVVTRAAGHAGLSLDNAWTASGIAALTGFLAIVASVALFIKTGLYQRSSS